jgi:hypothetical protein
MFPHPIRSFVHPFPPVGLPDLPRYSPPSSVLWVHTTPASPLPMASGCPRPPATSSARCLFAPLPAHLCRPWPGPLLSGEPHLSYAGGDWEVFPSSWRIPVIACPGLGTPAAPNGLALSVVQILPSAWLMASAPATTNDFGAESSRPTISLCLRFDPRRSPGERQDSLPACPLRL